MWYQKPPEAVSEFKLLGGACPQIPPSLGMLPPSAKVVYNHWTGMVEWNGGIANSAKIRSMVTILIVPF